ncbi:MAG: carbon-nitrogen hydrolase family protein [bacterium]
MTRIQIALAQIATRLGDIRGNQQKILDSITRARKQKAHLLVTPELSVLGYGAGDIYIDKARENLNALNAVVKHTTGLWAIVGFVDVDDYGFLYNAAALIGDGKIHGIHRKLQLVNYRLFDEKRYFKPGNRLEVFPTPFGRVGILICEDAWFPETARALALRGADLLVCIGASPYDRGKDKLWEDYLRVRCLDNIVPLAFCNQAGIQDGVTFWGGSMMFDAEGKVLKRGKLLHEDFVLAGIPAGDARHARRRDIRIREIRRDILQDVLQAYDDREKS